MSLSSERLRTLLLEYLKAYCQTNQPGSDAWSLQFSTCVHGVNRQRARQLNQESENQTVLTDEDKRNLQYVAWDLILGRILIPGTSNPDSNKGWPCLLVTDHGLRVLAELKPVPYDPDKYLERLKRDSPALHPTVLRYVEEAITTFRTECNLASAVMLGAASEHIFDGLTAAILAAIRDSSKKEAFEKSVKRDHMRNWVNAVRDWCREHRNQLAGEWAGTEQVEVIEQLAHFIRKRRNETGHPNDPPSVPTHEQMYAWLVVFPDYCRALCALKAYLDGKVGAIA